MRSTNISIINKTMLIISWFELFSFTKRFKYKNQNLFSWTTINIFAG